MSTLIKTSIYFFYYFAFLLYPTILEMRNQQGQLTLNFNSLETLLAVIANCIPMFVIGYILSNKEKSQYRKIAHPIVPGILWPLIISLTMIAINASLNTLYKLWPVAEYTGRQISAPCAQLYVLSFVSCLAIGYSEETFFRRAARDILRLGKSPWITYMLTSMLFGIAHMSQGVIGIVFSTIAGLGFAFFYEKISQKYSKNWAWHTTSIGHALYNYMIILMA